MNHNSYNDKNSYKNKIRMSFLLRFDGGANPNPGPCAGAYVIYKDNEVIAEGGDYIEKGTNNIGEYTGLIRGLERCYKLGITNLKVEGDSLLVISQVTGKWKINQEHLRHLCNEAKSLIQFFASVKLDHIRREYNSHADRLSDNTLEKKSKWEV